MVALFGFYGVGGMSGEMEVRGTTLWGILCVSYEGARQDLPVIGQSRKFKIPFNIISQTPIFIRIDVYSGHTNDAI